jgi:hypothetical protein
MILGQIARILSETEVVLNVGSLEQVKENMEFVIFSEGENITDPETGQDLGPIETVKGRLKVTHVMENMSRAKTLTYEVGAWGSQSALSRALYGATETRRQKLQVQDGQVEPIKEDLTVQVGDMVRSLD